MTIEPVALALREHQTSLGDWPHADLARELHRFVEIFDVEFNLHLPSYPTIKFEPIRNAYATYAWFRGAYGEKDTITFNTRELCRPAGDLLATNLHELLHLHQHYYGQPGRHNYHNKQYRDKALECGLLVDERGCSAGYTRVFTRVLAKHGVHADTLIKPISAIPRIYGAKKRELKLKKWSCRCTNVRCSTHLVALCGNCGEEFRRV